MNNESIVAPFDAGFGLFTFDDLKSEYSFYTSSVNVFVPASNQFVLSKAELNVVAYDET